MRTSIIILKSIYPLLLITGMLYIAVNLFPLLKPIALILCAIAWGIGLTKLEQNLAKIKN